MPQNKDTMRKHQPAAPKPLAWLKVLSLWIGVNIFGQGLLFQRLPFDIRVFITVLLVTAMVMFGALGVGYFAIRKDLHPQKAFAMIIGLPASILLIGGILCLLFLPQSKQGFSMLIPGIGFAVWAVFVFRTAGK